MPCSGLQEEEDGDDDSSEAPPATGAQSAPGGALAALAAAAQAPLRRPGSHRPVRVMVAERFCLQSTTVVCISGAWKCAMRGPEHLSRWWGWCGPQVAQGP